jgi:hypothetical protein
VLVYKCLQILGYEEIETKGFGLDIWKVSKIDNQNNKLINFLILVGIKLILLRIVKFLKI